jgi:hypothetical protein
VEYADGTTGGQSAVNSAVGGSDLSGGDESKETENTWVDGDCIGGDGAADHGGGCGTAPRRSAGVGSDSRIGGDAGGGDGGVVAQAFAERRGRRDAGGKEVSGAGGLRG